MSEMQTQSVPEKQQKEGRNRLERAKFMERFSLILLILMTLSLFSLVPVYLDLRVAPVLLDMGITIVAVVGLVVAYESARRQATETSAYAVLFVALLMVLGLAVEQGPVFLSAVPVLLGVLLTVTTVWPRQWLRWVLTVALFTLFFVGVGSVEFPIGYNLAEADSVNTRYGLIVGGSLVVTLVGFIRFIQRGSIRARLIISYMLLALLPVILIGFVISFIYVQRAQEQIFSQLGSVASLKEEEIVAWVEQLQSTLAISLDQDDIDEFAPTLLDSNSPAVNVIEIEERLGNIIEETGLFQELFILDLEGQVAVSTDADQVGKIQSSQTYFRQGINGTYFQPPIFFPSLGTVSMIVARPLTDSGGETIGLIAGRVNLDALNTIMIRRGGLGETGETYLVGINSAMVTQSRFIETDTTLFVRTEGSTAAIARQENGQGLYADYRDVPVVGVYRWLPEVQMAMLSEQDQSEAFSAIQTTVTTSVLFVGVTIVVAVGVALFMARSIATPVIQLAGAAQAVAIGKLEQRVDIERDDEIGLLAEAFNSMTSQLRQLVGGLEHRVAEQTRDLTVAAEVGQRIATERDLSTLLAAAAELIANRFNLYHAQIYLTDPSGQLLILRASTGTVGQELLRRGHRLTVGPGSINGSVAAERQAIIVSNTQASPTFRPNPLLPKTRSEMAVPLLIGTRIVGVLDLQSAQPDALSEANLTAFQALAGQLAIAIDNAALFTEVEQARITLEEQSRRLTRTNWDSYLDAITHQEKLVYAHEAPHKGETSPSAHKPQTQVVVPIQLTNEPIGFIKIEGALEETWGQDKLALVNEVASRVAQQVENLRLFAEAEEYRTEAEQAVRRLTREGWDTYQRANQSAPHGFVYTQNQVIPMSNGQGENTNRSTSHSHPLIIRGESIGDLTMLDADSLTEGTTELLTAVAETLAVHIENLRLAGATETALAQTETLYNLTAQLSRADTLEQILESITNLRRAASSTLLIIDVDAKGHPETLTVSASWPTASSMSAVAKGARFPISLFPVSSLWMANPNRAILIDNMATDSRLDPQTRAMNEQFDIKAAVYLPLYTGNKWVGLLTLSWNTEQIFTDTDRQLFDALAAQAAVVINNRLLFEETTKRAERESLINTINQRIQSATSVETALEITARELGQLLKTRRAVASLDLEVNGKH
ncbi:MAG: GAF domain-containing protein [Chloroflexi bacterium]|nr:GAF domain-containing protein [Chloroflexota bacterium]